MLYYVIDRETACERNVCPDKPHAIISIYTPGDPAPELAITKETRAVLQLAFDDLDDDEIVKSRFITYLRRHATLFDAMHAKQITTFYKQHHESVDAFIVHCDAGISRSGAVAEVLRDHFGGDLVSLGFLCPNRRVTNLLHAQLRRNP